MRVRFVADFDWYPPELNRRSHIAFKAGMKTTVRRKCGEDAIAAGAAHDLKEEHDQCLSRAQN